MLHIRPIVTLDGDPNLQPYRTMRRQMEQRQQGIFVAEGEKVVRRLLESNFIVVSVLLPEKWLHALEPLLKSRPEEIHAYVAEKEVLENLTGFSMYQGVLAVGKIPAPASLDQILERAPRPFLLAAVDGLNNAENLGTLVRNCAAFGVQALVVGETAGSPFLRRAVRSSMGAIFKVPVVETSSLLETLRQLGAKKLRRIGAHPHAQGKTLAHADLLTDCCIVFGSEGYGLSAPVLGVCDERVAIPMASEVDSLNVGSAAAAFLYEANRQRGKA